MPTAIKLQAEFGDALQVIFVESQGAKPDQAERFALERKWMGTRAMWTSERPFSTGTGGLPSLVLLDQDGVVLESGLNSRIGGAVEDHIEAFLKDRKKFPKDRPKALKKAWTYAQKGKLADAVAELAELEAEGDEAAAAATTMRQELERKVDARFTAITWMLDNGYPLEGADALETLAGQVDEHEAWTARAAELTERLEGEAMETELDAAKALAKLVEKLYADGPDEKLAKKLTKLAEQHAGTKVAARATHLATLAG